MLCDLGVSLRSLVRVLCDNVSSLYLTTYHVHHDHSKHIVVDYHFVLERVHDGDLVVRYVNTKFQLPHIFH